MIKDHKKRYRVHYMKPEFFLKFTTGVHRPRRQDLEETHTELRDMEATSLGAVFGLMQAENWSPNGEARSLITMKRLNHTSMCIGDVAEDLDSNEMWVCARLGWSKLD